MTDEKTRALIAEARLEECSECSEEDTSPAMRCDGYLIRRLADALEASLTVVDGDAREWLNGILGVEQDDRGDWAKRFAGRILHPAQATAIRDAILATFPAHGRDIAGEIEGAVEQVKSDNPRVDAHDRWWTGYLDGLRRAAEIARNGR